MSAWCQPSGRHRRIGFLTMSQLPGLTHSAADRVHGYRADLTESGLALDPELVFQASSDADGDSVVAELLSRSSPPTALMVSSDELALSVLAALCRAGTVAPCDISVLGFDDHAMSERFGLSTIAQPVSELVGWRRPWHWRSARAPPPSEDDHPAHPSGATADDRPTAVTVQTLSEPLA